MSKVLIIGGASFLGSAVSTYLLQNTSNSVCTVDDLEVERDLRNLQFSLGHKRGDRHRFNLCSLTDLNVLHRLFQLESPDTAVFCPALCENGERYMESALAFKIACKATDARGIIAIDDYLLSVQNETYDVVRANLAGVGGDIMTAEFSAVYGPRMSIKHPIVSAVMDILGGDWPRTSQLSTRPREWVYIQDFASAVSRIIADGVAGTAYRFASPDVASSEEVGTCIKRIFDQMPFDFCGHVEHQAFGNAEAAGLGWEQKFWLKNAIEHTLSWYHLNSWALGAT